jgi:hypothetical protein
LANVTSLNTSISSMAELDHLVIAARTLAEGCAYVVEQLGVHPLPGGQHLAMGTHNALVNLGNGAYLEVIAIDPDLPKPQRARWFALDTVAMQERLALGPALVHWVARTPDIHASVRRGGAQHGDILELARGRFRWQITVPSDGHLPGYGLVPTLIQWMGDDRPVRHMPTAEVQLVTLALRTPEPPLLRATLDALGLSEEVVVVGRGDEGLVAIIQTAKGTVALG